MNGYLCYWKTAEPIEVYADTQLAARDKAVERFQAGTRSKVKPYDVRAILCEIAGEEVTHTAVD